MAEPEDAPLLVPYTLPDIEKLIDLRLKFVADAWGKATAYDTAITIAGYGAFFALWSKVGGDVTPAARGLTAALLGASLVLYVSWSLIAMLSRHRYDLELIRMLASGLPVPEQIIAWERIEAKKQRGLVMMIGRLWPPVFGLAVCLGFLGAMLLTYSCLAVALHLPQFTGRV